MTGEEAEWFLLTTDDPDRSFVAPFVKSLSVVDLTQCAPRQLAQPSCVIAELPAQGGSYDADTEPRTPRFGAL